MWLSLSQSDFETMKSCLHPDVHYEDVPTPDSGATGPDKVIRRLSVAWKHLEKQIQITHHIAADGNIVFLDHTEKWVFKTGESAEHRFATMHELRDGKIITWRDFWDVKLFSKQFPDWFLQEMASQTRGAVFTID
jgi:limonene-1,2-epoxide hydrolase